MFKLPQFPLRALVAYLSATVFVLLLWPVSSPWMVSWSAVALLAVLVRCGPIALAALGIGICGVPSEIFDLLGFVLSIMAFLAGTMGIRLAER